MVLLLPISCGQSEDANTATPVGEDKLFTSVSAATSGIDFQNKIVETEASNYYKYMYTYIGGGVAAADFNNDGLEDLFFVSNQFANKLYLNKGDLKFEDISEKAGIVKRPGFDAGVAVADVNNDGFLDIYITRGGWQQENNGFANMMYINNGDLTFTEKAEEYGLAENNRSIAATFFDYDKDGDLDVYISNTPDFEDKGETVLDLVEAQSDPRTLELKGSDKLYQNDGTGHFTDVSQQAGIMPDIGFGLNPQVGDLNNDGWLDVYVCNDFRIPDFVYINQKNGTFKEGRNEFFQHMSFNSMGGDIADVNNDGLPDLLTLDMNPEDYVRSKTTMAMTSLELFAEMVQKDYHHQYMHNMLQINNGEGAFSEIANLAGVANTDWSWSVLMADFDLDGYNDVLVTNGVFRDVIDRDKNNEILQILRQNQRKPTDADFLSFAKMLPQQKLTNYFFKNKGDLTFENVSSTWTDSIPTFSNGATYTDLDNDGDLEVVINNINDAATILKNNAVERAKGDFLKVQFSGTERNKNGVGTIVNLHLTDGSILTRQLITSRGFLSSVSNTLHLGLKKRVAIEMLEVIWPDGKSQYIKDLAINQTLTIRYEDAMDVAHNDILMLTTFEKVKFNYAHIDPSYNDYSQQILLPHKLSQTGPAIAKADVNGDGREDVFLGGGHTQAGQLFLANSSGGFSKKNVTAFQKDKQREYVGASFFDADQDGDLDLYVASGSYEFKPNSKLLVDRLYLNDGKGNFTKTTGAIPEIPSAASIVVTADYDGDGDVDIFVGGRVISGNYPFAPTSLLLLNEGGTFALATPTLAPELEQIGMVTDAAWHDLDGDEDLDLIVTGEWMGIEVFTNEGGQLTKSDSHENLFDTKGWWNAIQVADVDQDGDADIIAGNLGLNYKFHASPEKPFHVYARDFDFNGTADVFLAKEYQGIEVPVRGKTCTAQQLPHLANKIPSYAEFAINDLEGILGPALKSALHYEANEFRSGIFLNEGNGAFIFSSFPNVVQQSPINSILYEDFDGDGIEDLLLAGNNYQSEIETTRADAGIGVYLKGFGEGEFQPVSHLESGFFVQGDVRGMLKVGNSVFVANNNDVCELFTIEKSSLGSDEL